MSIWINPEIFTNVGFREIGDEGFIDAKFFRIHVFKLHGYDLDNADSVVEIHDEIDNVEYWIGIGRSVNRICRKILGDPFVENEEKWSKDKETSPPYLLVHYGPTSSHRCTSGLVLREGASITTIHGFENARLELMQMEQKVLPRLFVALYVKLSGTEFDFGLIPLSQVMYGTTPSDETVKPLRVSSSPARFWLSKQHRETTLSEQFRPIAHAAKNLHGKSARFFYLAMDEKDDLKKFLYFFLAIEVLTHSRFQMVKESKQSVSFINVPIHVKDSVQALLYRQYGELRNLLDRFIWCAVWAWQDIDDKDVLLFKRLKEIRDGIAHGRVEQPSPRAVRDAEDLALKLLRQDSESQRVISR